MLTEPLSAIRTARPALSLSARAVVEAVFMNEGPIGSTAAVAQHLGLPNRFRLGRLLERNGLPSLLRLAHWALIFSWVTRAERERRSLCDIAFKSGRHPGACYRLVKRVTGRSWVEVRERGVNWLLELFVADLEPGTTRLSARAAPVIRLAPAESSAGLRRA